MHIDSDLFSSFCDGPRFCDCEKQNVIECYVKEAMFGE